MNEAETRAEHIDPALAASPAAGSAVSGFRHFLEARLKSRFAHFRLASHARFRSASHSAGKMMTGMLIALCAMALTLESYANGNGLFPLTDTGDLPAHVLRTDDDAVTFRSDSAVERIPWWDLDLRTADHIGRKSEQFRILDTRTLSTNDFRLVRAIVSRRLATGGMRYYIHGRYTSHKRSGTQNASWLYSGSAPLFIDDNTILIIPNHLLLAYRDFDSDNVPEEITIERPTSFVGNRLVDDDPGNKEMHLWRVSFHIGDHTYSFNVRSKTMPQPPEPCDGQGECITMDGQKLKLAELRAGQTSLTLIPGDNIETESDGEVSPEWR